MHIHICIHTYITHTHTYIYMNMNIKGRTTKKERPAHYSSDACNNKDWVPLKPCGRNSTEVFHMDGRIQMLEPSSTNFTVCAKAGNWIGNQLART